MWSPNQYLRFGDERTQPARDLLQRIPAAEPGRVIDLGCGPGNSTALLRDRWPDADIDGYDSSASMLAEARKNGPAGVAWIQGDIAAWSPGDRYDVVYSNAALHWLPDHARLMPRLAAAAAPKGFLAIQMPRNFAAPSHQQIYDAARNGPWSDTLAPILRESPVAGPAEYYSILSPHTRHLDIWETEYLHQLSGKDPVYNWVKGSAMTPLLAALNGEVRTAFETACRDRLRAAYPPQPDGKTLFPFRRIFIVAAL